MAPPEAREAESSTMIFYLITLLLVAVVAYFHLVQGFFTATISAICAVIAASLALGYHENVAEGLLGGRAGDYAHAMATVGIFALSYLLLRVLFDTVVPGNIRVPLYLEKGGAVVMGVVAGLFSVGTWAIAAQMLPFGPSIGGYARYAVNDDKNVAIPRPGRQAANYDVRGSMEEDAFDPQKIKSAIPPLDQLVLTFVSQQSAKGALAGKRPFEQVHPDFLTELYGQRIGVQTSAKRVAVGPGGSNPVSVEKLFRTQTVTQTQGELTEIHPMGLKDRVELGADETFLVVRTAIADDAADKVDNRFRFSLGTVRLVAAGQNWYPVGTLEDGGVLFASRMDDYLLKPANKKKFDLVFRLPTNEPPDRSPFSADKATLAPGAFLEIKRMGRVDLATQPIGGQPTLEEGVGLQWKPGVLARKPGAPRLATDTSPLEDPVAETVSQLFTGINVGTTDRNATSVQFNGGTGRLENLTFAQFEFDGSRSVRVMSEGELLVRELSVPGGKRIVLIKAGPRGDDLWKWSDLSKFELTDTGANRHRAHGAWAKVAKGTATHLVGRYDATKPVSDVPTVSDGEPTEVTLIFIVPAGIQLSALRFEGKPVASLNLQIP